MFSDTDKRRNHSELYIVRSYKSELKWNTGLNFARIVSLNSPLFEQCMIGTGAKRTKLISEGQTTIAVRCSILLWSCTWQSYTKLRHAAWIETGTLITFWITPTFFLASSSNSWLQQCYTVMLTHGSFLNTCRHTFLEAHPAHMWT